MSEKPFPPGRRDPCFCGSGLRFKHCCGSFADDRQPPYGVHVIENFLSAGKCNKLVDIAAKRAATALRVVDPERSSANKTVFMRDPHRITERVEMSSHQPTLNRLIKDALRTLILPAFDDKAAWFEPPHILKYSPGGYYNTHADSDYMDPKSGHWDKILDRDVSLLMYLNGDYSGGALRFNNFNYTLQPQPGMLVFFPSDHRYLHTAEQVSSGIRYALVSWVALQKPRKVCGQAPESAIRMD
jgi:predicted 2-oxoglutarate/Fe(II)-dependent dioxygenase YbiX